MFPDTYWHGRLFLFLYVELVPEFCSRLSATPCIRIKSQKDEQLQFYIHHTFSSDSKVRLKFATSNLY
jgi:hypothetical protein